MKSHPNEALPVGLSPEPGQMKTMQELLGLQKKETYF